MNEEIERECDILVDRIEDMSIPMILLGPISHAGLDEWKRIVYSFLSMKKALEDKMMLPIKIMMVDFDTDISAEVLNEVNLTQDELELIEFRDNGIF